MCPPHRVNNMQPPHLGHEAKLPLLHSSAHPALTIACCHLLCSGHAVAALLQLQTFGTDFSPWSQSPSAAPLEQLLADSAGAEPRAHMLCNAENFKQTLSNSHSVTAGSARLLPEPAESCETNTDAALPIDSKRLNQNLALLKEDTVSAFHYSACICMEG